MSALLAPGPDAATRAARARVAVAFTLAVPCGGHPCDGMACAANAARTVNLLGQDFHFCMLHWAEHHERAVLAAATSLDLVTA